MRREHNITTETPLPSGYTRLKSIGCTGVVSSNYILMDFRPQWNWTVRGEFSVYSNIGTGNDSTWICGSISDYSNRRQCAYMFSKTSTNNFTQFHTDNMFGAYRSSGDINITFDTSTIFSFEVNYSHLLVNGYYKSYSSSEYSTTAATSNFTLFRTDTNNASSRTNKHKIYWLSLSDSNDVLIHYFVPAMRDFDSKLGVYDTVTDRFYPVTGTQFNYETL